MSVHIFGIRHHGPGSARSVKKALEQLQPDIILVEGPPDVEPVLAFAAHADMKPPVALLAYVPDNPKQAVFYPFAEFSPEWQAMTFGFAGNVPVRMMDLPLTHKLAMALEEEKTKDTTKSTPEPATTEESLDEELPIVEETITVQQAPEHPLLYLAQAAGYTDSELWWEHTFEQRKDTEESFEAILESIRALREVLPPREDRTEILREAYMRKVIRTAEKEGFTKIAVICGAWHAPALEDRTNQKADEELLKKLPKVKIEATWIPWTYERLTFASGYGAGIHSPGWYQHLWDYPQQTEISWLTKVAQTFRRNQMDTSVAHVIEATRLAETLAILRNLPRPGLYELNEATVSVICFGDSVLMKLIHKDLIISNRLGAVPSGAPKVPLQHDLEKHQQKLKIQPKADDKTYVLDLRETNDLERSKLLHRLRLLDITWGTPEGSSGKGTFKEQWRLRWEPELLIKVIEMGVWGNTIEEATTRYIAHLANESPTLAKVAGLLEKTLPAELPSALDHLMQRINELASVASDILQLMQSLPPLAQVSRYGNVRKTDMSLLSNLVDGLVTRICIGLPNACYSLDDDAAAAMMEQLTAVNEAIHLLQQEYQEQQWRQTLVQILDKSQVHGLVSGTACRFLFDAKMLDAEASATRLSVALSVANEPGYSAAWLEGFLKGSGTILLLDNVLWHILNSWVAHLEGEVFTQLLPLLRRTFSTFSPTERRKIGEKAKGEDGTTTQLALTPSDAFDHGRAEKALAVVSQLLGL